MSWFSRKKPAASQAMPAADPPATAPPAPATRSIMARMNEHLLNQVSAPSSDSTAALNSQIVQAVQFTNAQNFAYAPAQIAVPADMMISQAAGLVAQAAAGYFDGVSKIALAAQAVLLQQMTENIVKDNLPAAAEDALGAWPPTCWWAPLPPWLLLPVRWKPKPPAWPSTRSTRASPSTPTPWPTGLRQQPEPSTALQRSAGAVQQQLESNFS